MSRREISKLHLPDQVIEWVATEAGLTLKRVLAMDLDAG